MTRTRIQQLYVKALLAIVLFLSAVINLAFANKVSEKMFSTFVLENGLRVVVVENDLVPIVTIELAVRNGSFTEGPEYAGLSHLYEHMFFKGNSNYSSSQKFYNALNSLGALSNARTQEEVVYYYFTIPVENLERGMELMANTVQTPLFDSLELVKEQQVVLGEFDRSEANPFFQYDRTMDSVLWREYVTRKQPIGQRDVILSATPDHMRHIQQKYYIPNNSLLIVAGNVDSTTVHDYATQYFNSWERGIDPFVVDPPPFPDPLKRKELVVVPAATDFAQIQFKWHGPSVAIDEKATYAADVFSTMLSQQQSRFQRNLVESGLAQSARVHYYTQRYTGPSTVQVVTVPEKAKQALDALWGEIQQFDSPDYFTDEELETAKATLRTGHLYNNENTSEWVHLISFWWSTTGIEYFNSYMDNLTKITRQDIQKYVLNYIKGKNYVLGITTSEEGLKQIDVTSNEVLR